jgi:hypothetical protein
MEKFPFDKLKLGSPILTLFFASKIFSSEKPTVTAKLVRQSIEPQLLILRL